MAARALPLAAAALGQVSRSAAHVQPWLRPGHPAVRLTSTTSAAPAAEVPNSAPAAAAPAAAPTSAGGQSNSGGGNGQAAFAGLGVASMGVGVLVGVVGGVYAVLEAWQQRENTDKALVEMKNVTSEAKVDLGKQVNDAKEAIRLQKEALQVQQQALESSVKTQTLYATIGPLAASALGFAVAYAGMGLINATAAAAGRIGK